VKPITLKTVLFDLDGTLADTAPDLAASLNAVLQINHRPALTFDTIRPVVSHGGTALIRLGFGIEPDHHDFEPLRQQLLRYYADNIAVHTRLFDGMESVLDYIEQSGRNWGVVTNKPEWLTHPLLKALGLTERAACVVSGDTLAERKPDPAPMLHACELAGSHSNECIYIGDAERDILAGKQAGMKTLIAGFGYLGENDRPFNWGADAILNSPRQIIDWLQAQQA
jgi:2-phosphoglycolate phosphatase